MGACTSKDDSERERSARIDRTIEEDAKRFKKECKILLLGTSCFYSNYPLILILSSALRLPLATYAPIQGSGESGKSTIVKQMKIIHQNGYTHAELLMFRPTIYRNLLESAEAVVLAMRKLDIQPALDANRTSPDPNAPDVLSRIEVWCSRMRAEGWWGGERGARGALMWQDGELEGDALKAAGIANPAKGSGEVTLGNFFQAPLPNGGDIDGPLNNALRKSKTNDVTSGAFSYDARDPDAGLPLEIAQAIHDLFQDPMFKHLVDDRSGEFYMMDSGV